MCKEQEIERIKAAVYSWCEYCKYNENNTCSIKKCHVFDNDCCSKWKMDEAKIQKHNERINNGEKKEQ